MMSDAFRCDCCDEFYSGKPAMSVDLTGRSWSKGGETFFMPTHAGGVNDADPVKGPEKEVQWPWQKHTWELCATCFLIYVAGALREALQMGRYGDD